MLQGRIQEVRQQLLKEKLDGVLISSVANITYLTGFSNFSLVEREAYLLIGNDFAYIITDARYSEAIKKAVPHFTLFERSHVNPISNLFKKLKKHKQLSLGIEEDNLTVKEQKVLNKFFKKFKDVEVGEHRAIKTADEINKIEKACKIGDLAFNFILTKIKAGISEKELAMELEFFIRKNGAEFSFPAIVAFGANSAVPHHETSDKQLTINDNPILLDFGVRLDNYCSDMTRTIFFGKPSDREIKIYETVREAQQKAIDFVRVAIKSGQSIKATEVDKVARTYITSKGFPSIPHSLGHGIGLKVHEHPSLSPKSKDILKPGMVFSIEPGIYLAGFGGIRIEDLFVYEETGLRKLTRASVEPKII